MSTSQVFDPGDYHGSGEAMARFNAMLAVVIAATVMIAPWATALYVAHFRLGGLHAALVSLRITHIGSQLNADLLTIVAGVLAWNVYKRLSLRIAAGGPEADFLDRLRTSYTTLLMVAAAVMGCRSFPL
jgi:hypothetical protein